MNSRYRSMNIFHCVHVARTMRGEFAVSLHNAGAALAIIRSFDGVHASMTVSMLEVPACPRPPERVACTSMRTVLIHACAAGDRGSGDTGCIVVSTLR